MTRTGKNKVINKYRALSNIYPVFSYDELLSSSSTNKGEGDSSKNEKTAATSDTVSVNTTEQSDSSSKPVTNLVGKKTDKSPFGKNTPSVTINLGNSGFRSERAQENEASKMAGYNIGEWTEQMPDDAWNAWSRPEDYDFYVSDDKAMGDVILKQKEGAPNIPFLLGTGMAAGNDTTDVYINNDPATKLRPDLQNLILTGNREGTLANANDSALVANYGDRIKVLDKEDITENQNGKPNKIGEEYVIETPGYNTARKQYHVTTNIGDSEVKMHPINYALVENENGEMVPDSTAAVGSKYDSIYGWVINGHFNRDRVEPQTAEGDIKKHEGSDFEEPRAFLTNGAMADQLRNAKHHGGVKVINGKQAPAKAGTIGLTTLYAKDENGNDVFVGYEQADGRRFHYRGPKGSQKQFEGLRDTGKKGVTAKDASGRTIWIEDENGDRYEVRNGALRPANKKAYGGPMPILRDAYGKRLERIDRLCNDRYDFFI